MKFTRSTKSQWLQHWKTNYQWLLMDQIKFRYHKKLNQRASQKKKKKEIIIIEKTPFQWPTGAESSSVLKRLYAHHRILISSWGLRSIFNPLNSDLSVHGAIWQPVIFNITISIWTSYKEENRGTTAPKSPHQQSVHMMRGTCKHSSWRHLMVWM